MISMPRSFLPSGVKSTPASPSAWVGSASSSRAWSPSTLEAVVEVGTGSQLG